ncbi:hypothetical protein KCU81_g174, partial [Aureobasidium melanogenum]
MFCLESNLLSKRKIEMSRSPYGHENFAHWDSSMISGSQIESRLASNSTQPSRKACAPVTATLDEQDLIEGVGDSASSVFGVFLRPVMRLVCFDGGSQIIQLGGNVATMTRPFINIHDHNGKEHEREAGSLRASLDKLDELVMIDVRSNTTA